MPLPFRIKKTKTIEIDGVPHRFGGELSSDKLYIINEDTGAPLQVPDEKTGALTLPTAAWFISMLRDKRIVINDEPLMDGVRRAARQMELDASEILNADPKASLRMFVLKAYDENPVPRGNKAIAEFLRQLFSKPETQERFGTKPPSAPTVRGWLNRGDIECRLMRDMLSMSGRVRRASRLDPVLIEVLQRHVASFYANAGRNILEAYAAFRNELRAINEGRVPRGQEEITYAKPEEPYRIPAYETFRRHVRAYECSDAYAAKYGKRAAQSRYGGGGHPLEVSHILELAIQDDTPLPGIFCIDADREIPLGQPTLTLIIDHFSRCILGWHITFSAPSQWTAAHAILHANTPKAPTSLSSRYPGLQTIFGKPSEIAWDNTLFQAARGMEDSLVDVGIGLRLVGVDEPTHKAIVERAFLTLKHYLVSNLPGATYDIPRMREFGYDPNEHAVVTLAELEVLLAEAIGLYHTSPHGGLMSRPPLLVWEKDLARRYIDLIWDEEEFRRSIGAVEYERSLDGAGISFKGLSYTDKVLTRTLLDDLAALEPRRRPTKNPSAKVKFKYDPNDLGCIHVWNKRTKRYVTLPCTQTGYADGLPLWLHERVQEFAKAEALAFNTLDERLEARESLSALIHEIAPQARQREKRILAKLIEAKQRKSLPKGSVETKKVLASPSGMESVVPFDLAAPYRMDAEVVPPRPRRGHEYEQRDRRDAGTERSTTEGGKGDRRDAGAASKRSVPNSTPKKTGTGSSWGDVYE